MDLSVCSKCVKMKHVLVLAFIVTITFSCQFFRRNPLVDKNLHVAALILARGGSKGIPLKNLAKVGNKTLLGIALGAAFKSELFTSVWVSTDHHLILKEAEKTSSNIHWRRPESATDSASSLLAVQEFLERHPEVDYVGLLQCTSPFINHKYLQEAINYILSGDYECVFSVTRKFELRWIENNRVLVPLNFDPKSRPRRQEWNGELVENGMFYFSTVGLVRRGKLQSNRYE